MEMKNALFTYQTLFLCSLSFSICNGGESDVYCLQTLKASLKVSSDQLASWNFNNVTKGFICNFYGIQCLHNNDNQVLSIRLPGMGLEGHFPSLQNCSTLTSLDLSSNNLSGPIPSDICEQIQYVTVLDLSSNSFSGEIPERLSNCSYLNTINLQNNEMTGQIPPELSKLDRLKLFNVANNRLTGMVPSFTNVSEIYGNNLGLCDGTTLPTCTDNKKEKSFVVIIGAAIGGVVFAILLVTMVLYYLLKVPRKRRIKILKGING